MDRSCISYSAFFLEDNGATNFCAPAAAYPAKGHYRKPYEKISRSIDITEKPSENAKTAAFCSKLNIVHKFFKTQNLINKHRWVFREAQLG